MDKEKPPYHRVNPIVFILPLDASTLPVHVHIKNFLATVSCLYYESLFNRYRGDRKGDLRHFCVTCTQHLPHVDISYGLPYPPEGISLVSHRLKLHHP
jgi:hypothetical protein